jgi:Na+/citrate or Na+/malate symporter
MNTATILLSIWISISLVMGIFAITQRGYQHRMSPLEEGAKSIYSFLRGFITWPVLFPIGLAKSKYKCKTVHKVSAGKTAASRK